MSRRTFLQLTALIGTTSLLAAACTDDDTEDAPMDATEILAEAGLADPQLDAEVTDGTLEGDEQWSKVVTFSGTAEQIDTWVSASFASGIESRAYRDDLEIAASRLGDGVQKKGDLVASGTEGSVAFVVVVGQEDEPRVHAAIRRTGR